MKRKTVILGNGLGMAINTDTYSLDSAIGRVWDDAEVLSHDQKKLVCKCLPDDGVGRGRPQGEEELDKLQTALAACDLLAGISVSQNHLLSEDGKKFPEAVSSFIYQTALQFVNKKSLPKSFTEPLADFVKATNSHIATLNYDNLLYQPFIDAHVLRGYDGALVDGFTDREGFNDENMERLYNRTFGYYLHLHGSHLFVDEDESTIKLSQTEINFDIHRVSSHIVLTHVRHKPTVIAGSAVLRAYWRRLQEALSESEELLVVGYSGTDNHLNELIKRAKIGRIRVVEWKCSDGNTAHIERKRKWSKWLGQCDQLHHLDNILEFKEWQ